VSSLFPHSLTYETPRHELEMNHVFIHPVSRMSRNKLCIRTSSFQNIIEINCVLVHYLWKMLWSEEAFSLFPFRYCAGCWISDIFPLMWISLTPTEKWKIWHGYIDKFVHYAWEFVVNSSLRPWRNGAYPSRFILTSVFTRSFTHISRKVIAPLSSWLSSPSGVMKVKVGRFELLTDRHGVAP
jgi:hypothetical protein